LLSQVHQDRCLSIYRLVYTWLICISPVLAVDNMPKHYILATATTGGTYYPVGVAIATLTKVRLDPKNNFDITARSSAGSQENIQLLRDNDAQFALLQGLYAAWAWNGEGTLKATGAQKHLRSVTTLWQNVEHFVVLKDFVKTGTLDDLRHFKHARFSIGKRNSGTEGSGRYILEALGIDINSTFKLTHLGYGASADALQSQRIQGMNMSGGAPVSALARTFAKMENGLRVLDVTDEQLEKINSHYALWSHYEIPAATYPSQQQAIQTIAQPNILAVREDVNAEHVYLITKLIYENLNFLHGIHSATKTMTLEKALTALPMPLHPGAARYYQEQGLTIPH